MPTEKDWQSFWDIATPQAAARKLRSEYGEKAVQAATQCAEQAGRDDRPEDQRFWDAVIRLL